MTQYQIIKAESLPNTTPGIILDVRTLMEHNEKHLSQEHLHRPLDQLNAADFLQTNHLQKDTPLYLLCRSGKRAAQAAEKFIAAGCTNVNVIEGGIMACENCGHTVKGTQCCALPTRQTPLSLERQVRIAAGLFTATGAFLALTVNSVFAAIPLAVGLGLIFAGLTDRCGLALVLTKAPWNKIK